MDARQGCSPMTLALAAGQVQRVLVEAGSVLVVTQGAVTVRFPFAWLAEHVVARSVPVSAEAAYRLEDGGWVDLVAERDAEAVIVSPEGAGLWARVGKLLDVIPSLRLFDKRRVGQTLPEPESGTGASAGSKCGAGFRFSPE
jgi:hypothetical protein